MILHPLPPGFVAIPQSAHALLAFQLADHWGNRTTPRPAPRAEVLAAALLHDAGWDGREEPPRLAPDGLPLAFDTLAEGEREGIWLPAVERAGVRGRYVAYLVSHHVSHLAAVYSTTRHPEFLASEAARQTRLAAELCREPRYRRLWTSEGDRVNRAVVRLSDAIAVHLSRGTSGRVTLADLPQRGGAVPLEMTAVGERTYRLRPWPLTGRRLSLGAEGRRLSRTSFRDEDDLRRAWASAEIVRLDWLLLAAGEPRD